MGNPVVHSVSVIAGAPLEKNDRAHLGVLTGVANAAGGGAGQAVTTALTVAGLPQSGKYTVIVNPGQDATWYVTSKTAAGFSVVLTPRLAASTLAAGTFDVAIVG